MARPVPAIPVHAIAGYVTFRVERLHAIRRALWQAMELRDQRQWDGRLMFVLLDAMQAELEQIEEQIEKGAA